MDRVEILGFLRGASDLIAHACRDLTEAQLRLRPAPGEWSLLELACHLRDSAIEEGMRARRMIEEDNPTLEPYDEQAWAVERHYQEDDPEKVMTALRAYWTGYAYQLERFTDGELERPGMHPEQGLATVRRRAELEVEHVQQHLEQMQATRKAIAQ
jgi:hypothetical protein